MAVRAKMRCNAITLSKRSASTPEFKALLEKHNGDYRAAAAEAQEQGLEQTHTFDAPTVRLNAVTGDGSEEDSVFWQATPNGSCDLSIDNPDAAETFELGQEYYVDFTPAGVNEGGTVA